VKFVFIAAEKATYPVRLLCQLLEVSRSGYYAWVDQPAAPKTFSDAQLVVEIKAAMVRGRGAYGSFRVHRDLKAHGIHVNKKRVERLMRENDLVARQKRRFVHTTDSRHDHPIAPNVLERNFDVKAANEAWVGDVTYTQLARDGCISPCCSTSSRVALSDGRRAPPTTPSSHCAHSI
jgi:putative transposase